MPPSILNQASMILPEARVEDCDHSLPLCYGVDVQPFIPKSPGLFLWSIMNNFTHGKTIKPMAVGVVHCEPSLTSLEQLNEQGI